MLPSVSTGREHSMLAEEQKWVEQLMRQVEADEDNTEMPCLLEGVLGSVVTPQLSSAVREPHATRAVPTPGPY